MGRKGKIRKKAESEIMRDRMMKGIRPREKKSED